MKTAFGNLSLILTLFLFINNTSAQNEEYNNRLYYTAKIWGYVKYFHSEVAKGDIDWDQKLLDVLENINGEISDGDFNLKIIAMINEAGEMAEPVTEPPRVSYKLKYNLNLEWFNDEFLSDNIRTRLEVIKEKFRPQSNFYVSEAWAGNPTFDNDNQYYQYGSNQYPAEEYRLLALFRYWNIINYFFPYKYMMDQDWDTTLQEFIPKMIDAQDGYSYHLAFLELATRINDSHAYTYSKIITQDIIGNYYLPLKLKYVENETVITDVLIESPAIQVGDVIKSVDGTDIVTLRESFKKYAAGSNNARVEHNINDRIIKGQFGDVQLVLEGSSGQKNVTLSRTTSSADHYELIAETGPIWEYYSLGFKTFGYVDMGRLETHHINDMFSELWNTDAIIFDIRNYPNGTMWDMVKYLFNAQINIANFTVPDITYPGTLYWHYEYVGTGDFSQTYDKTIIILFDERTQSQAEYTVMGFEQHPLAVKMGSQTSGADGNVSRIYLPGGIYTYFTGLGCFYPNYTETQRIGIVPDIEVHPTIAGIREGRDEVLEAAENYIITVIDDKPEIYSNYKLMQNYPNPFNPETTIEFYIAETENVKLAVYDLLGKEITQLVDAELNSGFHSAVFDGSNLSSGIYFYKLEAGKFTDTKKLLLLK